MNYREAWANGDIEAGTLVDAIESQAATIARYETTAENYELLQAKVDELEAWKAEELTVMNPLMDYARSACTCPLGCSLTEWLVDDHKAITAKFDEQAREIERMHEDYNEACEDAMSVARELAALKAQQSVAVPRDVLADLVSLDREKRISAERHLYALLAQQEQQP